MTRPGTAQIAQNTWDLLPQHRKEKVTRDYSWMPVAVNMAALGNTPEASRRIIDKLSNTTAPQARFPAFFGPGHDWVPDHNWGGSGMVGLQEMLMAADPYGDGKIYLLPGLAEGLGCQLQTPRAAANHRRSHREKRQGNCPQSHPRIPPQGRGDSSGFFKMKSNPTNSCNSTHS